MAGIPAELAYLFRHAVLREAAYGLQVPSERGRLHELVVRVGLEQWGADEKLLAPFAGELAIHAHTAIAHSATAQDLRPAKVRLLAMGAGEAAARHRIADALSLYGLLATDQDAEPDQRACADLASAKLLMAAGRPRDGQLVALRAAGTEGASAQTRVQALAVQGNCESEAGRRLEAESTLRAALREAETLGDADRLCETLAELGHMLALAGKPRDGEELLSRALACEHAGEAAKVRALGHFGTLHRNLGRLDVSTQSFEKVRAHAQAVGNAVALATTRANLALNAKLAGDYPHAEQEFELALTELRVLGVKRTEAALLNIVGNFHAERGNLAAARKCFEASIGLALEGGMAQTQAMAEGNLALLLSREGRVQESLASFEKAIRLSRESGNTGAETTHMANMGAVLLNCGRNAEAESMMLRTVQRCREVGNHTHELQTLNNLSIAYLDSGRVDAAIQIATQTAAFDDPNLSLSTRLWVAYQRARIALLVEDRPQTAVRLMQPFHTDEMPRGLILSYVRTTDLRLRLLAEGDVSRSRRELETLRAELTSIGLVGDPAAGSDVSHVAMLVEEHERAAAAGRVPLVFRGYAAAELSAELRFGLLRYVQAHQPEAFASLAARPELLAALRQGAEQFTDGMA